MTIVLCCIGASLVLGVGAFIWLVNRVVREEYEGTEY